MKNLLLAAFAFTFFFITQPAWAQTGTPPRVTIEPTDLTMNEASGSRTYTVVLTTVPTGNVTVTPSVPDSNTVTLSAPLIFTTTNWGTAQSITVQAVEDPAECADGTVTITHTVSGYPDAPTPSNVVATVTDNQCRPEFGMATVANQTYIVGIPVALTLPEATGGENGHAYHLNLARDIPPGLTWTNSARTLIGTPTAVAAAVTLEYSVDDRDSLAGRDDADHRTFTITVAGVTISQSTLTMQEHESPTYTIELDAMPSRNITVTPSVPDGSTVTVSGALTFSTTNWDTAQTVTVSAVEDPSTRDATVTITHTIAAAGTAGAGNPIGEVVVTVRDSRSAPDFGTAMVANQTYIVDMPITPLTLPEATAGNARLEYHLNPPADVPAGLVFDRTARTLTGTPTAEASAVTLTYEVTDADRNDMSSDADTLTFTITIVSAEPAGPAAAGVTISPTALTVNEDNPATYTAVLDTLPLGDVTVAPTAAPASLATVSGALTFTTANWNTAQTITVTALGDANADTDTVTITHAVSGYGSVANADTVTLTVLDTDPGAGPRVILNPPTLTVAEGSTSTYTVVLATEPTAPTDGLEGEPDLAVVTVTPVDSSPITVSGALTFFGPGVPSGLWNVAQTITVTAADTIDDAGATVTITHMVEGYGSVANPELIVILPQPPRAPTFGSMTVDAQTYTVNAPIPTLTLPEATGGNDALVYTLTGIPAGLAFDSNTRTLSGTPAMETPTVTLTYTVADSDANTETSDTDSLEFDVTVEPAPEIDVDPTALTVDEGNRAFYTVVLATEPDGDVTVTSTSSDTDKLTITGTSTLSFSVADWNTAQTLTVSATVDYDGDDETVTITHAADGYGAPDRLVIVTVNDVNTAPGFNVSVENRDYPAGADIPPLTLPEATGGNTPLSYALTGSIPAGLTFTPNTRILSGTPTTMAPAVTLTYTVTDDDSDESDADSASLTFTVRIGTMASVIIDPPTLTVEEGSTAVSRYTVVLSTMPPGAVTVTPTVSGTGLATLSALTFAAAAWNTHQTVTVSAPANSAATASRDVVINHAVSGYGSVSSAPDVTVTITLRPRVPSFGSQDVDDRTYTVNAPIPPLTLPEATGGNGALSYTLTGSIPGLSFDDDTRTLSGTPTEVDTTGVTLTYTAADSDGNVDAVDTAVLNFTVTVDRVPAVAINPPALTVEEGSTVVYSYTVVLTTDPGGDVTVTPAISDGTKLTITSATALTFSAADWSTAQTVTVSGTVDYDADHETVTITHAVDTVTGYRSVTAGSVTVTVTDVNSAPVFDVTDLDDQTYTERTPISTLTLPAATGGNTPLTYTLAGTLPAGLTFDRNARTLTGTPVNVAPAVTLTYIVTDGDNDRSREDTATRPFTVTIALAPDIAVTPTALTMDEGRMSIYTVVLITMPDAPVIVTPMPDSRVTTSGALTFSPATWSTEQTVTVTAALDADTATETITITHPVSGYGRVTTARAVSVVVNDVNGVPAFESTVDGQTYTYPERVPIPTLTLPAATGGDGRLSYALTGPLGPLPDGLTFIPASRTLVGCPVVVTTVTLTYTVSDTDTTADDDEDMQIFTVRIAEGNPTVTLSTSALTVAEGTETFYTMVLTTKPVSEAIITPTVSDSPRLVTSGALTFTTTNWLTPQTVTVTSQVDRDRANDIITITHDAADSYGATIDAVAVTVTDNDNAPDFGGATVATRPYNINIPAFNPIALTLPEAAGGDGSRVYALSPLPLPAGLTFDRNARTLTVTSPVLVDLTLTWTVSDSDRNTGRADEDFFTFPLEVTINPQVIVTPADITVAESGEGTYTVVLTTAPDAAVAVQPSVVGDPARLTSSGDLAFSASNWNIPQTVTVTAGVDRDADPDTVSITHSVTGYGPVDMADAVTVTITDNDNAPDFGATTVRDQPYSFDVPTFTPEALTLPEAEVGDDDLTYALTPFPLPSGLSYTRATRVLTVTDPLEQDLVLTYTVSDADTNTAPEDEDMLTFRLTVHVDSQVIVTPTALTVREGTDAVYTVVLTTDPRASVTVTPTVSDGDRITGPGVLSFGTANWDVVQTVTVVSVIDDDTAEDAVTIDHRVAGYREVTEGPSVSISIPDTRSAPTFGLATVSDQTYTLNTLIPTLTLPRATAGDAPLRYTLTPSDAIPGLTLTMGENTLSGTPTIVVPAVVLTWEVVDEDGQRAFLPFTVLVKSDLDAAIARRSDLNRVILPEVARALADQGVGAISERIRQASDSAGVRRLTVGGQSTVAGALTDHGRALIEGRLDLKNVLAGSDFVLPLNAREVVPGTGVSALSVWGSGDYRRLSGNGDNIDWEGGMFTAQLGADARVGEEWLAGVAISWGDVGLNYDYTGEGTGDYDVGLTTVYPYLGWTSLSGRLDMWATAGYGWGDLRITDDEDEGDDPATRPASSDITMKTLGAGGSARLLEGHGALVRIKGEALQTVMDIDGSEGIASTEVEARRMRISVEASHARSIVGWGELVPSIEVGMRHDAGDGRTGVGAEVGGRVRYTDVANGLTIESHGRVLLGHSGGYRDWGIGGLLRLDAGGGGGGGRGLSLSVRPTWGVTSSRVSQVWAQEAAATVASAAGAAPRAGRVDFGVGYGLDWGGEGRMSGILVTPYGQMSLTSGLERSYRVGGRMRLAGGIGLNLEGTRQERADRRVDHGILLKIGLSF